MELRTKPQQTWPDYTAEWTAKHCWSTEQVLKSICCWTGSSRNLLQFNGLDFIPLTRHDISCDASETGRIIQWYMPDEFPLSQMLHNTSKKSLLTLYEMTLLYHRLLSTSLWETELTDRKSGFLFNKYSLICFGFESMWNSVSTGAECFLLDLSIDMHPNQDSPSHVKAH